MELVWINDGSDITYSNIEKTVEKFEETTRFTSVVYMENDGNKGIGYTLNRGINLCSNEIIIKMDSDDIMIPTRIIKQWTYEDPKTKICGGQVQMFDDNGNNDYRIIHHYHGKHI